MTEGIKPKTRSLSDTVDAAIKNIELHINLETGDFICSNHLLTDFAIPQLKEAIARLRR